MGGTKGGAQFNELRTSTAEEWWATRMDEVTAGDIKPCINPQGSGAFQPLDSRKTRYCATSILDLTLMWRMVLKKKMKQERKAYKEHWSSHKGGVAFGTEKEDCKLKGVLWFYFILNIMMIHELHKGIRWETNQESKHIDLINFLLFIPATEFVTPLPT